MTWFAGQQEGNRLMPYVFVYTEHYSARDTASEATSDTGPRCLTQTGQSLLRRGRAAILWWVLTDERYTDFWAVNLSAIDVTLAEMAFDSDARCARVSLHLYHFASP